MQKISKNEEAVSPVIGVILMVAITVILAAVIAAFVFGMTGSVAGSKSVGVTAKTTLVGTTNTAEITYQGGADDNKLSYLKVVVSSGTTLGTPVYNQAAASGALGALPATPFKPDVGSKYTTSGTNVGAAGTNKVTVSGKFTDGSEQVLLDTTV